MNKSVDSSNHFYKSLLLLFFSFHFMKLHKKKSGLNVLEFDFVNTECVRSALTIFDKAIAQSSSK